MFNSILHKRRLLPLVLLSTTALLLIPSEVSVSSGTAKDDTHRERENEKRLVISDYFLNEDDAGKVHAEGDHRVHVARITNRDLILDARFQLDFNAAFAQGPARPHGMAFK